MKIKKKGLILVCFFFLLAILVYFMFIRRVHKVSIKSAQLFTGETIEVVLDYSSSPILYAGHGFMIGDYFPKFRISFKYKGSICEWSINSYIHPMIINIFRGVFYLVVYDSEKGKGQIFKLYRFTKRWEKINEKDYPRILSIQNIFYLFDERLEESTLRMNPDDVYFRYKCITPKLWLKLENGIELYEWRKNKEVKKDFIIDFKKKYLGLSEYEPYSKHKGTDG